MERVRAVTARVSSSAGCRLLWLDHAAAEPAAGTGSAHEWGTRARSNAWTYKSSRVNRKTKMLLP